MPLPCRFSPAPPARNRPIADWKGSSSCFHAARLSDAICMNLSNAPAQQVDCFEKARAAQLECLQHVPSGTSARSASPERPTGTDASPAPRGLAQSDLPTPIPQAMPAAPAAPKAGPVDSVALARFARKICSKCRRRRQDQHHLAEAAIFRSSSDRLARRACPRRLPQPPARWISRQSRRPKTGWSAKRLHRLTTAHW